MSYYGDLLLDALSQESGSVKFANEEGYAPQGTVMIEIPDDSSEVDSEIRRIGVSLESKGWTVLTCKGEYSKEDGSDGVHSGLPSVASDNKINNVVNGVFVPELKPSDVYQVVQIVRPEDTVKAGTSKILYLMNGDGDIKNMLQEEGHLVVNEQDALHLMLQGQINQ